MNAPSLLRGCPSNEQLIALSAGRLPAAELDQLAAHVDGCGRCQEVLAVLEERGDTLQAALRKNVGAEAAASQDTASFVRDAGFKSTIDFSRKAPAAHEENPPRIGRYEILGRLGSGGMGTVYLAYDQELARRVALKAPKIASGDERDVVERFYREARSAAALRHPNICPVFDVGEADGRLYLTMAYIEGRPLGDYISPDRLQPERSIALAIRKIAKALDYAHRQGVVHRDLKPSNIMMDPSHGPIVMDFGLALRLNEDTRLTSAGLAVGTPSHMSPEQVEGDQDRVGPQSDIYSLGVILYEMLTGRTPFSGSLTAMLAAILTKDPPPPSQLRHDLDPGLESICLRMMARNPADRFATMAEVADALTSHLQGRDVAASRSSQRVATAAPAPMPVAPTIDSGQSLPAGWIEPPPPPSSPMPLGAATGQFSARGDFGGSTRVRRRKTSDPQQPVVIIGGMALAATVLLITVVLWLTSGADEDVLAVGESKAPPATDRRSVAAPAERTSPASAPGAQENAVPSSPTLPDEESASVSSPEAAGGEPTAAADAPSGGNEGALPLNAGESSSPKKAPQTAPPPAANAQQQLDPKYRAEMNAIQQRLVRFIKSGGAGLPPDMQKVEKYFQQEIEKSKKEGRLPQWLQGSGFGDSMGGWMEGGASGGTSGGAFGGQQGGGRGGGF